MLCCAMGIAAVATGAISWRRFRRFLSWRLDAQSALAAVVVAMIAITITGLGHLRHHAAYAGDGQTLLTGLAPLCRGGAVADRITDIASTEE